MPYGDRSAIQFNHFRSIDPQRTHIWPEAYVAQEEYSEGILPAALNVAFSNGRIYWRRNRLYLPLPAGISQTSNISVITRLTRTSNVVLATTSTPHYLSTGDYVYIYATGSTLFANGWYEVLSVPSATSFTYSEVGADADITPNACKAYPNCVRHICVWPRGDTNYLLLIDARGRLLRRTGIGIYTPSQWLYGYSVPTGTWTEMNSSYVSSDWLQTSYIDATLLPNAVLHILGGGNSPYGGGARLCDDTQTMSIGLEPVHIAPTAIADITAPTTGSNALAPGRYTYYVAFYNEYFESMRDAVVDVITEGVKASGTISAVGSSNVQHGDSVSVGGQTYTFITTAGLAAAGRTVRAGDVWAGSDIRASIKNLYEAMRNGATITDNTVAPATAYTPPCANVNVELANDSLSIRVEAAEEGEDGNNIALQESTSGARLSVSSATLSGGRYYCHIDLSSLPTTNLYGLATDFVWRGRKIYRAYSPDKEVRGTEYRLVAKIDDMITTSYEDNTPQELLGAGPDFDYAMPPRGQTICLHKGRVWIGGILRTSPSYDVVIPLASASRVNNVFTGTTTKEHGLNVGDDVYIAGCFGPYEATYSVVSERVSATQFRCAWVGSNASSSGAGHIRRNLAVYRTMQNAIAFSEAGPQLYWPAENIIHIGGFAPVVKLVSFYDELVILKQDGIFILTGETKDDMRVQRLAGSAGCFSPGVAVGPDAIIWAGQSGWEMYDGSKIELILRYSETASYENELPSLGKAVSQGYTGSAAATTSMPIAVYNGGRYYLVSGNGDYVYIFNTHDKSWECHKWNVRRPGLFAATTPQSNFVIGALDWADNGKAYITYIDINVDVNNPPHNLYTDGKGTNSTNYANVYVELPPLIASPGEVIQPLEFWVRGSWQMAASQDEQPHLYLSLGENTEWLDMGVIKPNECLHLPAGYMGSRVRFAIKATYAPFFVVHSITVAFQQRRERANA